jgi:paired amphipathic helix protein Sin3a
VKLTLTVWQDEVSKKVRIFLVKKDDPTFSIDGPSQYEMENRWRHYIASYSSVDSTDGVDQSTLSPVLLLRSLRSMNADSSMETQAPLPLPSPPPTRTRRELAAINAVDPSSTSAAEVVGEAENQNTSASIATTNDDQASTASSSLISRILGTKNDERLILRIAVNNYHPLFQPATAEGFFENGELRRGGSNGVQEADDTQQVRAEDVTEEFQDHNDATRELDQEKVEEVSVGYEHLWNSNSKPGESDREDHGDDEPDEMDEAMD